jgi:hypothetical protein
MIERKIVIGLITSTEFLRGIKDIWESKLLESDVARRLSNWCWEYYNKYEEAPGREIETIFYSKIKDSTFPKAIAEEIEQDILPALSKEFEITEFNVEYVLEEAIKYLNDRHLARHNEDVEALLAAGKREEAEKLALSYKPLGGSQINIEDHILDITQIRELRITHPTMILKPWLREGQVTILYGNFGTGKSLLTLLIGYLVGLKDPTSKYAQIGRWQVKNSTGCLYVDGELGLVEMEERLKQYEWLGEQAGPRRIQIFSLPEYQVASEDTFNLASRVNQIKVLHWLREHPKYKLIILDSASTLFGLEDENSNSEWSNKINPMLRELRAMGIACLLLHHSGKDGRRGLRGASAMGAMAHNIYRITDHENKDQDDGEAWFTLFKDKQRAGGLLFRTFSIHFSQTDNKRETHWEVTDN